MNLRKPPDENYCLFGAESLLKRLKTLETEIDGVCRADDIECIHRMRVASRRLRSAFRLFDECFDDKDARNWQKQIKAVTKSLGFARDYDVQIDFLLGFLDDLDNKRYIPGIKRILLRLQQQREKIQPKVVSAMDQLRSADTINQITESARITRNLAQIHRKDEFSLRVYEQAYMSISLQLEQFLSHREYIDQPDKTDELHAMRIDAKRLRYMMEIYSPLYEDELKEPISTAKEIQTILGNLNDCVVWINFLSEFVREEEKRTFEYFGNTRSFGRIKSGILYLQENRRQKQTEYYNSFFIYWEEIQEKDIWGNLMRCIFDYVFKRGVNS